MRKFQIMFLKGRVVIEWCGAYYVSPYEIYQEADIRSLSGAYCKELFQIICLGYHPANLGFEQILDNPITTYPQTRGITIKDIADA